MAGNGKALERALSAVHDSYWENSLAWMTKANPEARVVRRRLVWAEVGPPDYLGCLAGGRLVALEAKESHEPNWRMSKLKVHQAEALDKVRAMGGMSFIVFCWGDVDYRLAPWDRIRDIWWNHHQFGTRPASLKKSDPRLITMTGADWLSSIPE